MAAKAFPKWLSIHHWWLRVVLFQEKAKTFLTQVRLPSFGFCKITMELMKCESMRMIEFFHWQSIPHDRFKYFSHNIYFRNEGISIRRFSLIPGSGISPGLGNGNPLQYSAWKMTWREKPGRLQSIGYKRVKQNWVTEHACPHKLYFTFWKSLRIFSNILFSCIFSPQSTVIHCRRLHLKLSCIILFSISLKIFSPVVVPHFSGFCNQISFKELKSASIFLGLAKNDLVIKLLCFRLHFHF